MLQLGLRRDVTKTPTLQGFILAILCQHRPIFPGRRQPSIFATAALNFRVRNGNGWTHCVKITDFLEPWLKVFFCVSVELSSRAVASQVFSPLQRLTSVFGMGTGGPTALKTLTHTVRPLGPTILTSFEDVGSDLFSRDASIQVSSAQHSLTSVFGMGTGGPCAL